MLLKSILENKENHFNSWTKETNSNKKQKEKAVYSFKSNKNMASVSKKGIVQAKSGKC